MTAKVITTVEELALNVTVLVAEFQVPPVTVGVALRSVIAPLALAVTVKVALIEPVRLKVKTTGGRPRRRSSRSRSRSSSCDVVVDDRHDAEAVDDREAAGRRSTA